MSSTGNVNIASGASKYIRPTLLFIAIAAVMIITHSIAVSKVPSTERKGAGFGLIAFGLFGSCALFIFNLWVYGKETGAAKTFANQGLAKVKSMFGGGAAGAAGMTNVGAPAAV